jgi:signal transduction histidine kinase
MTAELGPDDDKLQSLIDMVVALASNDFSKRVEVGDGSHLIDGIATGLNMLAEEVGQRAAREQLYQQRMLQQERLIAVGQLAAGVAHELNNPAAFVLANLEALDRSLARLQVLLSEGASKEEIAAARGLVDDAREACRDNETGVQRIVSIVRDLRSFSRSEPHAMESVALDEVVSEACGLSRAEIAYRAELVVCAEPSAIVRANRTKLVQVFTNLLLNAAHAIVEGAREDNEVRVVTSVHEGRCLVTVSDTGTGMTEDVVARMFEPFFTTKPRDRGTGLGLAISADILSHHGGEIRLVETSRKGTTFEVSLPLAQEVTETKAIAQPAKAHATPEARPAKVLIVDDEPLLLTAYQRFFAGAFDLTLANSGRSAIALLQQSDDWDAILCDLMMSDMDGVVVHDWLRDSKPALLARTLFCTGGAFTPRTLAFAKTMSGRILSKPLRLSEVQAAVERVRTSSFTSAEGLPLDGRPADGDAR